MIERPKKKDLSKSLPRDYHIDDVYNQACNDWELYHEWAIESTHKYHYDSLPSEDEIRVMIDNWLANNIPSDIIKAIYERIKGEK